MFRREKDGNGRYLNCMSGFGVDGKRVRWDTRVGMIVLFVFSISFCSMLSCLYMSCVFLGSEDGIYMMPSTCGSRLWRTRMKKFLIYHWLDLYPAPLTSFLLYGLSYRMFVACLMRCTLFPCLLCIQIWRPARRQGFTRGWARGGQANGGMVYRGDRGMGYIGILYILL